MSYKVETVIKNVATCGEGPYWDEATQTLLYVDTEDVHRWDPATGKDEKIHLDGVVGFVIPRSKGGLVVGLNLTLASVDWDSKTVTTLATVEERPENMFNDGKCDASGRLWAGTVDTVFPWTPNVGNLYSFETCGSVRKHLEGVTVSNGLAWTGDNKTMFHIDTPFPQVYAYDFDLDNGTMSNQRVAVDFTKIPEFSAKVPRPDGMTTDAEDKLWVACLDVGAVSQFDLHTGKLLQKVEFPNASMITSVCWGGTNLDELYVTSMRLNHTEEQLKPIGTLAGSVFRVTGLGAKGKPAYVYQG